MKIITSQIDRDTFILILSDFMMISGKYWGEKIKVAHGGVSQVDDEKQYQYKTIDTKDLINQIYDEEKKEDFRIGEWDYFITDESETDIVQLCHESDIHFEVMNQEFSRIIESMLQKLNIKSYTVDE